MALSKSKLSGTNMTLHEKVAALARKYSRPVATIPLAECCVGVLNRGMPARIPLEHVRISEPERGSYFNYVNSMLDRILEKDGFSPILLEETRDRRCLVAKMGCQPASTQTSPIYSQSSAPEPGSASRRSTSDDPHIIAAGAAYSQWLCDEKRKKSGMGLISNSHQQMIIRAISSYDEVAMQLRGGRHYKSLSDPPRARSAPARLEMTEGAFISPHAVRKWHIR